MPAVSILVSDSGVSAQPVDGVTLKIYNELGSQFITLGVSGDSGVSGMADFILDEGVYQIRATKIGTAIRPPILYLEVDSSDTQSFYFRVDVNARESADDTRLCRCTGYFTDLAGRPNPNIKCRLHLDQVTGAGGHLPTGDMYLSADESGKIVVDMYRGAVYEATITGFDDESWQVRAPDASWADLIEVLFPILARIGCEESDVSIPLGDGVLIRLLPVMSSGAAYIELLDTALSQQIAVSSSAPLVASVSLTKNLEGQDCVLIVGSGPGEAEISFSRVPSYPTGKISCPDLMFDTIHVQVT